MSQSSPEVTRRVAVLTTPWFEVVAKTVTDFEESYYSIKTSDYVTILAVTEAGEVPLIRQYRPVVEDFTLELPSGHVERDEAPLDAALRELREETGFVARRAELLGVLVPDTGRLENRLWCYFTDDIVSDQPVHGLSTDGLEVVLCNKQEVIGFVAQGKMTHALDLAVISLAIIRKKVREDFL